MVITGTRVVEEVQITRAGAAPASSQVEHQGVGFGELAEAGHQLGHRVVVERAGVGANVDVADPMVTALEDPGAGAQRAEVKLPRLDLDGRDIKAPALGRGAPDLDGHRLSPALPSNDLKRVEAAAIDGEDLVSNQQAGLGGRGAVEHVD